MRAYLLAVANREIPTWLRRFYDADDAVQEAMLQLHLAGDRVREPRRWATVALRNLIHNAMRDANARITGRKRIASRRWSSERKPYPKPTLLSREPEPSTVVDLHEQLNRLTPRQRKVLLGDEPTTKGQFRMIQARARDRERVA